MKRCILVCGLCTVISIVAVVMETFTLLALQFCDGEDLIMLYWSTWSMLQIGSVVAICGVMLSVFHSLRDRKHPSVSPLTSPRRRSADQISTTGRGRWHWAHLSWLLLGLDTSSTRLC